MWKDCITSRICTSIFRKSFAVRTSELFSFLFPLSFHKVQQRIYYFPHGRIQLFTSASYTLPYQTPFCLPTPLLSSLARQQYLQFVAGNVKILLPYHQRPFLTSCGAAILKERSMEHVASLAALSYHVHRIARLGAFWLPSDCAGNSFLTTTLSQL
jgi:hypothetical protein